MQNFANGDHCEIAIMTLCLFLLCLTLKKSQNLFLQIFANGDHREIAIMALGFLSSYLAFRKKSKLIFAKFREWWPSRNCHHNTPLLFVMLRLKKSRDSFLQIFANSDHREIAIVTLRNLSPCLAITTSPLFSSCLVVSTKIDFLFNSFRNVVNFFLEKIFAKFAVCGNWKLVTPMLSFSK